MQDTVAKITDFMQVIERVCLVKRDTLMTDGSTENDAAHIFKLAFLIMLVYPYLQKNMIINGCWSWLWCMILPKE